MTDTTVTDVRTGDDDEASGTPDPGRSLVGRLGAIMDAFDHDRAELSLVDLGRRSGLPKSTAHRLAEQLCELGWLERNYRGYRVGMRLFELGALAVGHQQLREAALPHLHSLATRAGTAVQLGILDGVEVVYLERILVGPYRLPTRPGARMPAYCTGLGKAMLAYDELAVEQVLDAGLPRRTPTTIITAGRLRDVLDRVRATGVAYDLQECYEGMGCVAAPIRSAGRAIAAVSVTGPIEDVDLPALAGAVQRAAAHIWTDRFEPRRQPSKVARTAPRPANRAS